MYACVYFILSCSERNLQLEIKTRCCLCSRAEALYPEVVRPEVIRRLLYTLATILKLSDLMTDKALILSNRYPILTLLL